jgi:hypothetical protein
MKSHSLEFSGDVTRGDVVAGRTGGASLQQTVGEKANVRPNLVRANHFGSSFERSAFRRVLSEKIEREAAETNQCPETKFHCDSAPVEMHALQPVNSISGTD